MAYLVNQARLYSLTINGTNYTSSLVSWECSDASGNKQGIISTSGSLVLGQVPGGYDIEDYDRDNFKRGNSVILEIEYPDGTVARHPRGLLYVISASYAPEANELSVEIGCRLALSAITEDVASFISLAPIPLDPVQRTYANISASFSSAGKYLYQDNQGNLQTGEFFEGDAYGSVALGEWSSVLGVTTLSVEPLAGGGAIPDEIELSYQVPVDDVVSNSSDNNRVEISETESQYFITYPAISYQRVGTGLSAIGGTSTGSPPVARASTCGNTPSQPSGAIYNSGTESCNDNYETVQTPEVFAAKRIQTSRTEYYQKGGQVSRVVNETEGPALEVNQQFYADKFAYCALTWSTVCLPNGACPYTGLDNVLQSRTIQQNYYSPTSNELIKTITEEYEPQLAAYQESDWRSGVIDGRPQDFQDVDSQVNFLYRKSYKIVEYAVEGNINVETSTTYEAVTESKSGKRSLTNIDAYPYGVKTVEIRRSSTITGTPLAPDRVNTPSTNTKQKSTRIILGSGGYTEPPDGAGPYILKEQLPVPVLLETEAAIQSILDVYSRYLISFVKGTIYGLTIGEALRKDIAYNWYPGKPFRYYDPGKNKLMAMRMDATTWGVDASGAVLATQGIFLGYSNGSLTISNNLSGDSRPDMGSGTVPPVGPTELPNVSGETAVDTGPLIFEVNVYFSWQVLADPRPPRLPLESPQTAEVHGTFTCFVGGFILEPGNLVSADGSGSIPVEYNGSLVTAGATIVDPNLFVQ